MRNINGVDLRRTYSGDEQRWSYCHSMPIWFTTFDEHWEAYASIGQGFHSNDARGTTTRIDPVEGGHGQAGRSSGGQSLGGETRRSCFLDGQV